VAALKAQLKDPRAIERYLATYREERKRLAAEHSGKRSKLTRELAMMEREIERVVDGIARGVLADEDARRRVTVARRRRDAPRPRSSRSSAGPKWWSCTRPRSRATSRPSRISPMSWPAARSTAARRSPRRCASSSPRS
jgi:hypothetical protein